MLKLRGNAANGVPPLLFEGGTPFPPVLSLLRWDAVPLVKRCAFRRARRDSLKVPVLTIYPDISRRPTPPLHPQNSRTERDLSFIFFFYNLTTDDIDYKANFHHKVFSYMSPISHKVLLFLNLCTILQLPSIFHIQLDYYCVV